MGIFAKLNPKLSLRDPPYNTPHPAGIVDLRPYRAIAKNL